MQRVFSIFLERLASQPGTQVKIGKISPAVGRQWVGRWMDGWLVGYGCWLLVDVDADFAASGWIACWWLVGAHIRLNISVEKDTFELLLLLLLLLHYTTL